VGGCGLLFLMVEEVVVVVIYGWVLEAGGRGE
jgi:hypothetical protein